MIHFPLQCTCTCMFSLCFNSLFSPHSLFLPLSSTLSLEYEAMTGSPTVEVTETTDLYTTVDTAKQDPLYANVQQKDANGVAGAAPVFDPLIPNTCPVSISDLGTHVASYHSDNNTAFNQQYQVQT